MSNEQLSMQDFFQQNKFIVIKNAIPEILANMLYGYCKTVVTRTDFIMMHDKSKYDPDWDGSFSDGQVDGAFYRYGDPMMDTLMLNVTNIIEECTNLELSPNYSYWRLYQNGNTLEKHIDRGSCEISATMCLGYDISNVDTSTYPNYKWPMFVESMDHPDGLPISLSPGDMIVYRGCDVEHWRDRFIGLNQAQVFLHYNDRNGPINQIYDGRAGIGIPKKYQKIND